MKIAFLVPHIKIAGGSKVILRLATELSTLGNFVYVCVYKFNPYHLSWLRKNHSLQFIDLGEKDIPDVDLIINFGDNLIDRKYKNIPKALFLQGFGSQNPPVELSVLLQKYAVIISTSPWLARLAIVSGHKNVHIASPGIDEIFSPRKVSSTCMKNIGCLHHESPSKNFALYPLSIVKLYKKYRKVVNSVILSSTPMDRLSIFDELGFPYSVYVRPEQETLPYMYSSCYAWVSTSINEGFGLSTLEAMACGCPVIWVPSMGLEHVLKHDENCLIVHNKVEIADAIVRLIKEPETRARLSEEGIKLASQFTWASCVNNFVKALKTL